MDRAAFLRSEIDAGSFPGAAWAVGTAGGGIVEEGAVGNAVAVPLRIAASPGTIYDCASLTKPLVTTTLVLQAVAEGTIALDDEYRGHTFRRLLSHSSGLRDWLPLYAYGDPLRAIEQDGPLHAPGEAVYSDLNFVLLYYALTELFGDYRAAAAARIFAPLQLRDATLDPAPALRPRVAATEWGQRWEWKMCAERSVAFGSFREGLIWGEVHDGNSFHYGGTLGNAGLFATARDVFHITRAIVRGELVPAGLVEESTRTQAGDRGLGWQLAFLGEGAFGHTGFTGTSVCVEGEAISVLLTNRVHPCAAPTAMQRIRERFHRAR